MPRIVVLNGLGEWLGLVVPALTRAGYEVVSKRREERIERKDKAAMREADLIIWCWTASSEPLKAISRKLRGRCLVLVACLAREKVERGLCKKDGFFDCHETLYTAEEMVKLVGESLLAIEKKERLAAGWPKREPKHKRKARVRAFNLRELK